jgi:uncharacterized membrane protein YqjE
MPGERIGVVSDVRGLAADAIAMVRTRLELIAIEVQEEKARIARQFIFASAAMFFLSFGTLLAILWLAFSLDEARRVVVIGVLAIAFLALAAFAVVRIKMESRRERPFAATLKVLAEDMHIVQGSGRG